MRIVDVDDPASWPTRLRAFVENQAESLRGTTETTADLRPTDEAQRAVHGLLAGCLVRAYHATRLLEHEVASIRDNGLRLLSADLVAERIHRAHQVGAITESQRD